MSREIRIGIAAPAAAARKVIDRLRDQTRRGRATALADTGDKGCADLAGHYGLVFFASVEEMIRSGEIDSLIITPSLPGLEETAAARDGLSVLRLPDSTPAAVDQALREWIEA